MTKWLIQFCLIYRSLNVFVDICQHRILNTAFDTMFDSSCLLFQAN